MNSGFSAVGAVDGVLVEETDEGDYMNIVAVS